MIKIETLDFRYTRSGRAVFKGFDLTIAQGGIYGLLGKNGTGKSTLLRLITGLLTPKSGSVILDGVASSDREAETLQRLFLLPEDFELPRITPLEFAQLYGKLYPKFSTEQFGELLAELEVQGDQKFNTMSFGQRKKGYIAFALACNTDYLLMDEPTNGLDIPSKAVFRRLVAAAADPQRTIIISTHQVRDLEELIDNILILDGNELLLNASTNDITHRLRFAKVENDEPTLYREKTVLGEVGVMLSDDPSRETGLNIEMLFNATVTSRETIKNLFKK